MMDTLLSVILYRSHTARPTDAKVSGSQSSVAPRSTFTARSPREGGPWKYTFSSA